jgi:hypothetical protein
MTSNCRFCKTPLKTTFVDLGMSPLSNAFIKGEDISSMERFYPLHAFVCESCFLVQLEEFESPEAIFSDYVYFSSYSESWLEHSRRYVDQMVERFKFNSASFVVEIASNDGYLLQNFVRHKIPCLGIEPAANVAEVAIKKGVPTEAVFFGEETAKRLLDQGKSADLLIGNNVFAHVPNINDFVAGMKVILAPQGVITLEFPHLLELIKHNEFDTIYHEHFSYLSLIAVEKIFKAHGLEVFAVEQLTTHGGSLRVYGQHLGNSLRAVEASVAEIRELEFAAKLNQVVTYTAFSKGVEAAKRALLSFLIEAKGSGKKIVAYGAAAKGNTLLNYCGIRQDFIEYVVDRNPHKQGLFTPGTHIPVFSPEKIEQTKPDYIVILPWNLTDEVTKQLAFVRDWGAKFVVAIPTLRVIE